MTQLDIVIPVYNEGENIIGVLDALKKAVRTPYRVLICYDQDNDNTLTAIAASDHRHSGTVPIKNQRRGPHGAVVTGFEASTAEAVLVIPADDDYNAGLFDQMVALLGAGNDIVCASRFMPGGTMINCPPLKAFLVRSAAFTLRHLARLPTHDPTNGLRLFSRRVLTKIPIESSVGFTYSLELLVKCHRLGWKISEIPAQWVQRTKGQSRFKVLKWIPPYLHWYGYAFATTYLRKGPETVMLRVSPPAPSA